MKATLSRPAIPRPNLRLTGFTLLVSDSLVALICLLLSFWIRYLYDRSLIWDLYLPLWPILLLFPLVYALVGLYPGVGITPPEELRRLTYASSLVFIVVGASTFMYRSEAEYSRGAFIFAWLLVLLVVPLSRALVRELFARKPWWGTGVVILGAGQTGLEVVRLLQRQPGLGLKPLALLDDDISKHQQEAHGVEVLGDLRLAPELAQSGVKHAIVAMPGVPRDQLLSLLGNYTALFPHLMLIPNLFGLSSLWVTAQDLGGMLSLEVRQRLLMSGPRLVKRTMDIGLVLLASPFILLVAGIVALLVRLDSPGPVVFSQNRPGLGGNHFKIFKFRTMYTDAEARMKSLPTELRQEFEEFGKIQNDPRVTKIGQWLRKLSLDEFPQFWNILQGDMSLVGPRAYLINQMKQMQGYEIIVLSVTPGLTGLWQVSGRSEVTFQERLDLDSYYVRNWSPWLDLYILARTVWVVLFSRGAY